MLESRDKLLRDLFAEEASPEGTGSTEGVGMMDLHATTQGLADARSSEGQEFHDDHTHSGTPDASQTDEGLEFHDSEFHSEQTPSIEEAPPMEAAHTAEAPKTTLTFDDLRRSVIMAEVLGKPVSMRRHR